MFALVSEGRGSNWNTGKCTCSIAVTPFLERRLLILKTATSLPTNGNVYGYRKIKFPYRLPQDLHASSLRLTAEAYR